MLYHRIDDFLAVGKVFQVPPERTVICLKNLKLGQHTGMERAILRPNYIQLFIDLLDIDIFGK